MRVRRRVGRSLTARAADPEALTYTPIGGIVAVATTSLPEHVGGARNWDYRYCWIRDATFTLDAPLVAGRPGDMQIMYAVVGDRRLREMELDWLPGYENSRPVRIGNAAATQLQLDVYDEVMDVMHDAPPQWSGI